MRLHSILAGWVAAALGLALSQMGCTSSGGGAEESLDSLTEDTNDSADQGAPGDGESGESSDSEQDGNSSVDPAPLFEVPEAEVWSLAGLSAPAYVLRTEGNVPHIYAANREDLGRVVGFTLARDRYFFMEIQRRYAQGTISALLGDAALENDMNARLIGMDAVAQNLTDSLQGDTREYLLAVVDGVNAYISAVQQGAVAGPSEFDLAGPFLGATDPTTLLQPFTLRDLMAIPAALLFETNFQTEDVARTARQFALETAFDGEPDAELRQQGFLEDVWKTFRPLFPGNASAPGFGNSGLDRVIANGLGPIPSPGVESGLLKRFAARSERLDQRLTHAARTDWGSNAWAVAGEHSASGGAVVAGDGHLSMTVPALMYQVGLDTQVLGGGPIHQLGLFLTPFPILGAGTNGDVAWSMVNPVVDITDWYSEQIQLDGGLPSASRFKGEWKPLRAVQETYEIADVPLLGSKGRVETWIRYETFDGRRILDIEGEVFPAREMGDEDGEEAPAVLVHLGTHRVLPKDLDGDGIISAVSFDYGAFDAGQWPEALAQMGLAKDVTEYREATRGVVGGGLFMAAGDSKGNVLFSSYQAIPCRNNLPRSPDGAFLPGAHPAFLLDGTQYGAFELPTDERGWADEGAGAQDPTRCVIPFEQMPQSINPAAGFVVTANNQPAPIDDDGDGTNDTWYLGGPWGSPRADSIRQRLEALVERGDVTATDMADVQADTMSRLGELFVPFLLDALDIAKTASDDGAAGDHELGRLASLWQENSERFGAVRARLSAWSLNAASGVATFYNPEPTAQEIDDAVATMIFNAWLPRFVKDVWSDESAGNLMPYESNYSKISTVLAFLRARGPSHSVGLASWNPATEESIFFDRVGTPHYETSRELMLEALEGALDYLSGPSAGPGRGGFGTTDMNAWLWGLRHQARFESLLAQLGSDPALKLIVDLFSITTKQMPLLGEDPIPDGDPRKNLVHFPRPGDNYAVDVAGFGLSTDDFTYNHGPVMRMVIQLGERTTGLNIIPGGQSGLTASPHFYDQAKLWLGNQTLPMRFHLTDVVEGASRRETFLPPGASTP